MERSVGISDATLRKIDDGTKKLLDFGYDDMQVLNDAKVKQIRVVRKALGINAVGTKRNLFKMTEEIIERCGEWYEARNIKCDVA